MKNQDSQLEVMSADEEKEFVKFLKAHQEHGPYGDEYIVKKPLSSKGSKSRDSQNPTAGVSPRTERQQMKQVNVDGSVVAALLKLHPDHIPEHLMQKNPVRSDEDFDPNAYFKVLSTLSMKPGYTLDYVYYKDHFAGEPFLYARTVEEKPLCSVIEYEVWKKKNSLLSFLVADGSPDGFFQLVVFRQLAGKFYLFWHANYNDLRILTAPTEIEALISEVNGEDFGAKFTEGQISRLRAIEPQPVVEVSDDRASVTYCTFTGWGGFVRLRESYRRLPPHKLLARNVLGKVKYDCGVCW